MTLPQHCAPVCNEEREGLTQIMKDIIMNGFLISLTYEGFLVHIKTCISNKNAEFIVHCNVAAVYIILIPKFHAVINLLYYVTSCTIMRLINLRDNVTRVNVTHYSQNRS